MTFVFAADGSVRAVGAPGLEFLGEGATRRRASHVEPARPLLRRAFHALRERFGEDGAVAAFTRRWPCAWRVDLGPSGGPVLSQTWRDRAAAIRAELDWLDAHI